MRIMIGLTLAVLGLTLFGGCDNPSQEAPTNYSAIDAMARTLLDNIVDDKPDMSYTQFFSPVLKSAMTEKEWKIESKIYQGLGPVKTITSRGKNISAIEGVYEGVCYYDVTWEKTSGLLQLSVTHQNGEWKITHLDITYPQFEKTDEKAEPAVLPNP